MHECFLQRACQLIHYARKAPQYPWPCPVHDVLAACACFRRRLSRDLSEVTSDLYLVDPPADAPHEPVSPAKIVFAGDSAGGALCLSVLTVLRDMGAPLPAGAVLISPWVDLTHSFDSVMTNTKTVNACMHVLAAFYLGKIYRISFPRMASFISPPCSGRCARLPMNKIHASGRHRQTLLRRLGMPIPLIQARRESNNRTLFDMKPASLESLRLRSKRVIQT